MMDNNSVNQHNNYVKNNTKCFTAHKCATVKRSIYLNDSGVGAGNAAEKTASA
jgi:hypothetical protein